VAGKKNELLALRQNPLDRTCRATALYRQPEIPTRISPCFFFALPDCGSLRRISPRTSPRVFRMTLCRGTRMAEDQWALKGPVTLAPPEQIFHGNARMIFLCNASESTCPLVQRGAPRTALARDEHGRKMTGALVVERILGDGNRDGRRACRRRPGTSSGTHRLRQFDGFCRPACAIPTTGMAKDLRPRGPFSVANTSSSSTIRIRALSRRWMRSRGHVAAGAPTICGSMPRMLATVLGFESGQNRQQQNLPAAGRQAWATASRRRGSAARLSVCAVVRESLKHGMEEPEERDARIVSPDGSRQDFSNRVSRTTLTRLSPHFCEPGHGRARNDEGEAERCDDLVRQGLHRSLHPAHFALPPFRARGKHGSLSRFGMNFPQMTKACAGDPR